jgi:hypothetical protein
MGQHGLVENPDFSIRFRPNGPAGHAINPHQGFLQLAPALLASTDALSKGLLL